MTSLQGFTESSRSLPSVGFGSRVSASAHLKPTAICRSGQCSLLSIQKHCKPLRTLGPSPPRTLKPFIVASSSSSSSSGGLPPPVVSLRAVPTHPKALNVLYLLYVCACLVERTWRFGLPLVLAYLDGGYQAIAVLGFTAPLACTVFGPAAGKMLDTVYRPYGLGAVVAMQGFSIIASGITVLATAATSVPFLESPFFGILIALSMIERLAAVSSELAIERDWVSQLAGKENDLALAAANAQLRRSDVTTELIGSLAFGWLYSQSGLAYSITAATLLAIIIVPLEIICVLWIAKLAPSAMVHTRAESGTALIPPKWRFRQPAKAKKRDNRPLVVRARESLKHALDGWITYFRQPILPSSICFVLLFCNVALAPGGLITAFLASWGLDGRALAVFKGGCATMGFIGTWAGKRLIRHLGLLRAGIVALTWQGFMLTAASLVFALFLNNPTTGPMTKVAGIPVAVLLFMVLVVGSRIGIWAFDMVNAQFFQQTVAQTEMASASSVEMALCSSSELIMLGLAAYVIAPEAYWALVLTSVAAVLTSNVIFRSWASKGGGLRAQAAIASLSV